MHYIKKNIQHFVYPMSKNSQFKYVLGIQCFATADSGACIIKVDYKNKDYDYVAISEERLKLETSKT